MEVEVKRSELVIGVEYYFSGMRNTKGIFAGRENGYIYFTPIVKGLYTTVEESIDKDDPDYNEEWKDKVYFTDDNELDGFEQVTLN